MIREMIEDALERGEKLKKDIVRQVLSSAALADLLENQRFTETVARVIRTKEVVSRLIRQNVQEVMKVMSIPTREQLADYDKRVQKLEGQIDRLGREVMRRGLKSYSRGTSKKRSKR